jgi:hypothetical protein
MRNQYLSIWSCHAVRAGKHVLAWKRESKRSVGNETDLLDKGATIKVVRAAARPWVSCLAREPAIKASALSVFPRPISFEPPVSANGSLLPNHSDFNNLRPQGDHRGKA